MDAILCPDCGSRLVIDPNCVIEEPVLPNWIGPGATEVTRRQRTAPAALCTGCEFAMEIVAPDGYLLDKNLAGVGD